MLALLIYLDGQGLIICVALTCLMHELGHLFAILMLGGRVSELNLTIIGAEMKLDPCYPLSYGREVAAALGGPMINLLMAMTSCVLDEYLFSGLNLCFGVLNLLPVRPLDGGRALYFFLARQNPNIAAQLLSITSTLFTGILLGLGWAAWQYFGNLTLLCTAVWLLIGAIK